jgi:Rad3-related DNA helicase
MAERIAAAIHSNSVFIAEAGTGTGKTFAYLVPALQSNGKVIVSTGTKTLQDQLFNKDLPMVRDIAQGAGQASRCSRGAPTMSALTTCSARWPTAAS